MLVGRAVFENVRLPSGREIKGAWSPGVVAPGNTPDNLAVGTLPDGLAFAFASTAGPGATTKSGTISGIPLTPGAAVFAFENHPPVSAARYSSASTSAACSAGFTLRKMALILPSPPMTKVVRSVPM